MNESCPRCGVSLEEGFLLDESHGKRLPSFWVRGRPQRSFWLGLKVPAKAEQFVMRALRCPRCGKVDFYASQNRTDYESRR